MKKTLLSIAIIAALPFGARAENISGAMYTAPARYDTNHPAPTTDAYAPYGRIDIDTADQEHIATTAYVKGAYNSAIAAVNKVGGYKQDRLYNIDADEYIAEVDGTSTMFAMLAEGDGSSDALLSADAIIAGILSQRVEIYTTWDDDDATTDVAFKTVMPQQE